MNKKTICILGLGYIGLPTAVMFANHGHRVHGVDINEEVVRHIQAQRLHIEENELPERLKKAFDDEMFTVSTTPVSSDVYIIAVPSPIREDKTANVEHIRSAARSLIPYIKEGNLIILESTVPPRTVVDVVVPEIEKTGLVIGEEVFVSHSPERVIPGKAFEELVTNDRIIGGVGMEAARQTSDLYRSFVKGTLHETDATTAELVKVMENTYRDVNIALANELARIADTIGVDIWEAIELANYHPRVNIHQPGPGVGGHCIAVDPWFLVELNPNLARLIHLSRQTNDGMPAYTAMRTEEVARKAEGHVALLGLAFKGNIDDMRESPSLDVIQEMEARGLEVKAYDPHIQTNQIKQQTQSFDNSIEGASVLVIVTNHDEFAHLDPETIKDRVNGRNVIDTKNCIDRTAWEAAGFNVYTLGDSKHRPFPSVARHT